MASPEFSISPFDPLLDNADYIARLHLASRLRQVWDGENVFTDIMDSQADLSDIESYYIEPGGNFWVAREAKEPIGWVGLAHEEGDFGILKRLAVMPAYRGQGLGKLLVGSLIGWASQKGMERIRLTTGEGEHARPIYESFGFRVTGFIRPRLDTHGDLVMERVLES